MNELQRILQAFKQAQETGKRTALVTVVQTQGSVYRRPGARMLLTEAGQVIGAISGGCLEADILERVRSHLTDQTVPTVVRYDTSNPQEDLLFGFGVGCNGIVDVLIESLEDEEAKRQLLFIEECLQSQEIGAIATIFAVKGIPNIRVGSRVMGKSNGTVINQIPNAKIAQILSADIHQALIDQKTRIQSYTLPQGQMTALIEVIHPPIPLLIFGAGYDAIPVVQFAKQLGWHVTVIDHRGESLRRDRFPNADRLLECQPNPPHAYLPFLTPQAVAVVMTHRYLSDLAFLKNLIPSPLRYLGVLGPQRRMEQLWQDLAKENILPTPKQSQRLYNPVGLDIAAETPEEIALSIIAEIQAVVSGRDGGFLRNRTDSIHSPLEQSWIALES